MTALRESFEEVGVRPEKVKTLGMLSDLYIPPSNFLVRPVVAFAESRPAFRADPAEVDHILEIPLESLLSKDAIQQKEITISNGIKWDVSCYFIDKNIIWGATAMILSELLTLITE